MKTIVNVPVTANVTMAFDAIMTFVNKKSPVVEVLKISTTGDMESLFTTDSDSMGFIWGEISVHVRNLSLAEDSNGNPYITVTLAA